MTIKQWFSIWFLMSFVLLAGISWQINRAEWQQKFNCVLCQFPMPAVQEVCNGR